MMENEILGIITMIVIFFILLILITIIKIHTKKAIFREGFFFVILIHIIIEAFLNLIILITIILIFTLKFNSDMKGLFVLSVLFIFLYDCDMVYHILTLISLLKAKKRKEMLDISQASEESSKTDNSINAGIKIKRKSFKEIHFLSFLFSALHAIIYFFVILKKKDINLNWYYCFINHTCREILYLFMFFFNYIFVGISIKYLLVKPNIDVTKLKFYSIYCMINSFISLVYPFLIVSNKLDITEKTPIKIIYGIIFLLYLVGMAYFRLNSFYVQNVLSSSKENKIIFGLQILFKNQEIPNPNIIDFNNSYLFHSLMTENDISSSNKNGKKSGDENNNKRINDISIQDIDSRSYSLVDND